ncbi:hypothetical protein BJ878DRAFT_568980 [Calycina marina]|uniref:Protein kinase domain-containing protein n=1 Tax=Calycina marina TaxID=1763456 RepID=A0A9P7YZG9_9HELO|nr:hypothetical protein BJ878DRAFT_568980 [Calycina marina]
MESLFSLPFPRRLTKMYTDTKSSYDFVKEPVQSAEDPELSLLHRKLRIQKDRLVSWGLEWSDPSKSPDIDESISKAGLSELVGSVMGTIKEILAEAEPLWQSSQRRGLDEKTSLRGSWKGMDRKPSIIFWDKSRFEDLVRDLTMSIDTLYDLSRTRQSARKTTTVKAVQWSSASQRKTTLFEERQFESTRMQTPQQIKPSSVIWPRDIRGIQSSILQPAKSPRHIVFLRRPISQTHGTATASLSPTVPVLLEHAPYDSIYSITGITPSMSRFEKLFTALSQAYTSPERVLSGLLRLIGYYEEPDHSRFCLLYALPTHFGPIDIETPRIPEITILSDLLYRNYEPSLEVKYRLAYNVANAVFDLHSKGCVHGNVASSNILFIEHQSQSRLDLGTVNMRESFLSSFDLFSDNFTDSNQPAPSNASMYRHPLDPRNMRYTSLTSESKSLDLYSLAMLLLEIGLWTSLPDIFPSVSVVPENPLSAFKRVAARCGSLYLKAIQSCWHAPDDELSQKARPDVMHQKVFCKVSKALDACCAIDVLSDTEDDSDDSPPAPSSPTLRAFPSASMRRVVNLDPPATIRCRSSNPSPDTRINRGEKPSFTKSSTFSEKSVWSRNQVSKPPAPVQELPSNVKSKLRAYPAIRINQEHLNFWQTGLMPHINHTLKGFYRKHPESVEISLENIGESPTTTKPTILVICTNVSKVRSILKKSLVYDTSVFGLKVCRGRIVRSRKLVSRRSMAQNGKKAQNIEHQKQPSNGASIGAYVNDRHLPPVSLGGMILVDDKPYGMTVHHMLDDPLSDSETETEAIEPILRSNVQYTDVPELTHSESSVCSSGDEEFMYELSDDDSDSHSEFDEGTEDDADDDSDDELEPGDIKGIPQGCGEFYTVTQPAIDDMGEDFYPDEETMDEEHLDCYTLGEIYASSGIRRRTTEDGNAHEIDWALFSFEDSRCPQVNRITDSSRFCSKKQYPLNVAALKSLSNMEIHCMARTSGLQSGRILPGMTIVKIYGRQTPSISYQVAGKLGIPGDSGAWVVGNEDGTACGHVLAWSQRKQVAYICPMELLLHDIGETLGAKSVSFPGGSTVYTSAPAGPAQQDQELTDVMQRLKVKLPAMPTETDDIKHGELSDEKSEWVGRDAVPIRLVGSMEDKTRGQLGSVGAA